MVQVKSKSDDLFDHIRSDILTLELTPDAPLRLPVLSERYSIGLTPLRESLNRLCSDRLVVPEHNKGFRVAPLTRAELLDLERSRKAIEGEMFIDAIAHGDDTWEAQLIGAYHHLSQVPMPSVVHENDALALWSRRHKAFHRALVAGSKSVWMHRFSRQIEDQLGRYQLFIQSALRDLANTAPHVAVQASSVFATGMALEPHQALYDAALSRNPIKARAAFDFHTGLSITAFEGLMTLMPKGSTLETILGAQPEASQ